MNRTIERWKEIFQDYVEVNGNNVAATMLQKAVEDMQELARQLDELVVLMEEVIRISDRKHDAWDAAKVTIAKIKEQTK